MIDRETGTLLEPRPVTGAQRNYPIVVDEVRHRLFVGCRQPSKLMVLNTDAGKPVADVTIDVDTDDLFYNPARRRVYVSARDGSIDVIDQRDADHYRTNRRVSTVDGARTATLSREFNLFCLGVPREKSCPLRSGSFR